jgi:hypothetical protein
MPPAFPATANRSGRREAGEDPVQRKEEHRGSFQRSRPEHAEGRGVHGEDSERFADIGGWGYGLFLYDEKK